MSRIPAPTADYSPRLAAVRPRRRLSRIFAWLLVAAALAPATGCVALSIPSERFHDAGDSGGIFGSWQAADRIEPHAPSPSPPGVCPAPVNDGPLLESETTSGGQDDESPVPWPRFHPVPTRPVFGPSPF